jgi:hypothetical protein
MRSIIRMSQMYWLWFWMCSFDMSSGTADSTVKWRCESEHDARHTARRPELLDRGAGRGAERQHLRLADVVAEVPEGAVRGDADDRLVPLRVHEVAAHDRAVVDPVVRVPHHLGHEPALRCLLGHRLRELDVDVELVVVAEEVREDRVDRQVREVGHAEEVVARPSSSSAASG